MWKIFTLTLASTIPFGHFADNNIPDYIRPCRRNDTNLVECAIKSIDHIRPYLANGIQDIEMPSVEPFIMDSLSLQLTDGPQGYKITLKNMEVYGASNFKVKSITFSKNEEPFKATIFVPKLTINATYTSSGVLIIIPASGGGNFHAELKGAVAEMMGTLSYKKKTDGTYMHVDSLGLGLNLDQVHISIANAFHNNRILTEATNLFLREHGSEVLSAMQPQLEKKLAAEFGKIVNTLLKHVSQDKFYTD